MVCKDLGSCQLRAGVTDRSTGNNRLSRGFEVRHDVAATFLNVAFHGAGQSLAVQGKDGFWREINNGMAGTAKSGDDGNQSALLHVNEQWNLDNGGEDVEHTNTGREG